ncbi:hypothetical protein N8T08_009476 [Aspergillus melleus]|uniref:Uncharacterized protein n=1 Tax=Aspergillus melleus TaxID=138277 RepID=A0ACC3BCY7_9EURO|nr:hypothetical protein N8T08_009476 [Aspergillus melleus]
MESISSLVSSVWGSLGFWKAAAIFFALLNLKTFPMVWHIRVYRYFFKHGYLITPAVEQPARPSTELLDPVSIYSRAPIMELDFNMHKSNSTYFSDLDVSRTALMSNIVVKGAALLEKQLAANGKRGPLGFILGSVYTSFKREIPAYMKYEVKSHVASYDNKWIYIITYFLKPGKKGRVLDAEGLKKKLYAVSISRYVLKKGRYTVPPKDAFQAAGYTPLLDIVAANGNGHATAVENGDANGDVTQRKSAEAKDGEWDRLKEEIDRGLDVVQPFIHQEEKLMEEYVHKMTLPGFA